VTQHVLHHLHGTELWASYLPRIPQKLLMLAGVGLALMGVGIWGGQNNFGAWAWASGTLGGLLLAPALAVGLFVWWRWNFRTGTRRTMLDAVTWRGDEQVLDVGCGSGLLLNGAAKRLKTGQALGIDIWAPASGGGNLDLLMRNARAEGVADKIEFKEVDARRMPFADGTFDVVMSSGALHHIAHGQAEFDQTLRELTRVLKPGGHLLLWDIQHMIEASASRMKAVGVQCETRAAPAFLGYEMGMLFGRKV